MKFFKNFLKPVPFAVGDSVTAFGNVGKIKSIGKNGYLEVTFPEAPSSVVFLQDGRLFSWSKKKVLRKV